MENTILKDKRIAANMTQVQLGEAVGLSNKIISRYENGTRLPPYKTLIKLAEVLGYDHQHLGSFLGDLRGQKYGNLTVISVVEDNDSTNDANTIDYEETAQFQEFISWLDKIVPNRKRLVR